jgi:(p)ppGpp synthase/HD superfamily hydrolase
MNESSPLLSSRFEDALVYTVRLHARQKRKLSRVPYFAHLMGVAALVLEAGGDEDLAIAALLHDAVEDQGGKNTLAEIRKRFGDHVADIVDSCSDSYSFPKAPWRKRKERYIQHLKTASPEARLVSLADKLHNARSILRDLKADGETTWRKFNGGKEGTLWYYRTLADTFKIMDDGYLVDEFERVVSQIEHHASKNA